MYDMFAYHEPTEGCDGTGSSDARGATVTASAAWLHSEEVACGMRWGKSRTAKASDDGGEANRQRGRILHHVWRVPCGWRPVLPVLRCADGARDTALSEPECSARASPANQTGGRNADLRCHRRHRDRECVRGLLEFRERVGEGQCLRRRTRVGDHHAANTSRGALQGHRRCERTLGSRHELPEHRDDRVGQGSLGRVCHRRRSGEWAERPHGQMGARDRGRGVRLRDQPVRRDRCGHQQPVGDPGVRRRLNAHAAHWTQATGGSALVTWIHESPPSSLTHNDPVVLASASRSPLSSTASACR